MKSLPQTLEDVVEIAWTGRKWAQSCVRVWGQHLERFDPCVEKSNGGHFGTWAGYRRSRNPSHPCPVPAG
eukprot:4059740-Amphidinium_carterae.1